MINAQPRDFSCLQPFKNQLVRFVKNFRQLHFQRHHFGDIEKSAIVDFLRADSPIRQAIMLSLDQGVEFVKRVRVSRRSIEIIQIVVGVTSRQPWRGSLENYGRDTR